LTIINSLDQQLQRVTRTQFSLYNSYQFVDLLVGIGYEVSLTDKWSFTPSIQMAYSIGSGSRGALFNQLNQKVDITEIDDYHNYGRWQGLGNLKLMRRFGKHWQVGISAFMTTSKHVAEFDEDAHSVSSRGLGLSLNRNF